MSDSDILRKKFEQDDIADGWEILLHLDMSRAYEGDWYMVLRGPDGELYENESGHCSCRGMEGQFGPVKSSIEALRKTLEAARKNGYGRDVTVATGLEGLIPKLGAA